MDLDPGATVYDYPPQVVEVARGGAWGALAQVRGCRAAFRDVGHGWLHRGLLAGARGQGPGQVSG